MRTTPVLARAGLELKGEPVDPVRFLIMRFGSNFQLCLGVGDKKKQANKNQMRKAGTGVIYNLSCMVITEL
jgi:hypothetical protein